MTDNTYLVCGNTMCVPTCQVDYVLLRTCLPWSRLQISGDFSKKKCVLLFNYYPGGRCRKSAGTTTLANCQSVLTTLPQSGGLRGPLTVWSHYFNQLALVIVRRLARQDKNIIHLASRCTYGVASPKYILIPHHALTNKTVTIQLQQH